MLAALGWVLAQLAPPPPPNRVIMTTGAEDGAYHRYAQRYRDALSRHGVELVLQPSSGAAQNLERLRSGEGGVQVGLVQGGLVQRADAERLYTLDSLFYEPIWIFYDCDHVIKGEGIAWLRRFLGQDPDAPIVHPVLPSTERQSILGVPLTGVCSSLLVPGLGCVNGCRFCSTTHFFGKSYTAYLPTGRALFEAAERIADARGTDTFFVTDENFLKDTARARELLAEMERRQRFFRFQIFSSAEAILAFGVDDLVRLGVNFVWMTVDER